METLKARGGDIANAFLVKKSLRDHAMLGAEKDKDQARIQTDHDRALLDLVAQQKALHEEYKELKTAFAGVHHTESSKRLITLGNEIFHFTEKAGETHAKMKHAEVEKVRSFLGHRYVAGDADEDEDD